MRRSIGRLRPAAGRTLTSELVMVCMPAAVCTSKAPGLAGAVGRAGGAVAEDDGAVAQRVARVEAGLEGREAGSLESLHGLHQRRARCAAGLAGLRLRQHFAHARPAAVDKPVARRARRC